MVTDSKTLFIKNSKLTIYTITNTLAMGYLLRNIPSLTLKRKQCVVYKYINKINHFYH